METTLQDSEQTVPQTYSISVEEFKSNESFELEENSNFGKVTRGNFIPTLINTFARSRGVVNAQEIMLDWMREHEGWDYKTTFINLREAGGLKSLTKKEQQAFIDSYLKVKSHQDRGILKYGSDVLMSGDNEMLNIIEATYPRTDLFHKDLAKLSKTEMLERVSEVIQKIGGQRAPRSFEV